MNGSFQPGVVDAIASQHVTYELSEREKAEGHVLKGKEYHRNTTKSLPIQHKHKFLGFL